jgi:hypothetical protein
MSSKKREVSPQAMMAIGVCFMGVGVAISLALSTRGVHGAGVGMISMGVIFLAIGAGAARKAESKKEQGDDGDRPADGGGSV